MAAKRSTPLEDPPAASSSSEEEDTTSGEEEKEEDSLSSDEETGSPMKKQASPPPQTQSGKPDSSEGESETESDSDTDSEPDRPNKTSEPAVKPVASKPMESTPTKKPRSKPSAGASASSSLTAAKRGSELEQGPKDTKRAKKNDSETEGAIDKSEDKKKNLFQRLWSEDDEIATLKGIIEFTAKRGIDPFKDMNAFYDFLKKKSLNFDFTLVQLRDKVLRLRKKFENHVKGKSGEDKKFSKAHDQVTFNLSKKIWGSERPSGVAESSVKSNGKSKKGMSLVKAELRVGNAEAEKEGEKVDKMEVDIPRKELVKFDKDVLLTGMEDFVLKKGMDVLEGAKKAEMEDKWRKQHLAELELYLKRNALIGDLGQMLLAAYKSADDGAL